MRLMKKPGARTFTTVLILALCIFIAGSGCAMGPCCVGMSQCAGGGGPAHGSADPCERVPIPGPAGSPSFGNNDSTPHSCGCSAGLLAWSRNYLPTVNAYQTSQRLQESAGYLLMLPAASSAVAAERYLLPPEPSESGLKLAYLKTVILSC